MLVGGAARANPRVALSATRGADAHYEQVSRPVPEAVRATPWDEPVDGLACRVLMQPDYCLGESLWAIVEVKNVSDRAVYFHNALDAQFPAFCAFEIRGPGGRMLTPSRSATRHWDHRGALKLAPGEIASYEYADLSWYFMKWTQRGGTYETRSLFSPPGDYTLVFRVKAVRLPERAYVGERTEEVEGQDKEAIKQGRERPKYRVEKLYEDVPPDVLEHFWARDRAAGTPVLSSAPVTFRVRNPTEQDLTVHEWGVFTVFNDRKLANINRKAEWESLPDEFYRQFPKQRLMWQPAAWDKPIVYFYSDRVSMNVDMQVAFPEGAPVVWWPCVSAPVDDGVYTSNTQKLFRALQWKARLGELIPVQGMSSAFQQARKSWFKVSEFPFTNAAAWVAQARLTNAVPVTVMGSHKHRSAPWMTTRKETERFIYYDGLVPSPDYLRCEAADDASVTIRSTAPFDIASLHVIDRRGGYYWHSRTALKAGQTQKVGLVVNARSRLNPVKTAKAALTRDLLEAGLTEAETDSLLAIWHDGLFGAPGITVFYVLPREEYDRMLTLSVSPTPGKTVRVGIARHPHFELEPELVKQAHELIGKLGAESASEWQAAAAALQEMGPVAWRTMEVATKGERNPVVPNRLHAILEQGVDAEDYLPRQ
jgi:hypothetical protein